MSPIAELYKCNIGAEIEERRHDNTKMSSPGAGFEYPRTEVSWVKRDALLFANSIGCTSDELHFLYVRKPSFLAPPSYEQESCAV